MIAAAAPRPEPLAERLLVVDAGGGTLKDGTVGDLPSLLREGDAVIVNDAATLPASFRLADGRELRLVGRPERGPGGGGEWGRSERAFRALLFGEGDWRTPTERRPPPAAVAAGDVLELAGGLEARVTRVDALHSRLMDVSFGEARADVLLRLYAAGKPIQYAHVPEPLALWDVQNRFASRPWAFEMPSAGRPLTFRVVDALRRSGVRVAAITHGAGVSSTGEASLDARLPLPERYSVSEEAVDAVRRAQAGGGRVVAVGTTVVRALEASFLEHGGLQAGEGEAKLVIGPGFRPRVATAVLTGMHPAGTSHFALLEAFAPRAVLERALGHAEREGYLEHEFGDSMIVMG